MDIDVVDIVKFITGTVVFFGILGLFFGYFNRGGF